MIQIFHRVPIRKCLQQKHILLIKVLILVGLGIPYGCERTKIYADSQYSLSNSSSLPSSLGICTLDEDCPQWECVGSKCEEGECVAYRNEGEFSSLDLTSSLSFNSEGIGLIRFSSSVLGLFSVWGLFRKEHK